MVVVKRLSKAETMHASEAAIAETLLVCCSGCYELYCNPRADSKVSAVGHGDDDAAALVTSSVLPAGANKSCSE